MAPSAAQVAKRELVKALFALTISYALTVDRNSRGDKILSVFRRVLLKVRKGATFKTRATGRLVMTMAKLGLKRSHLKTKVTWQAPRVPMNSKKHPGGLSKEIRDLREKFRQAPLQ